jgi:phenylpyruvate tautomerase PptA (4-oxalocrotonate tautomerase family)
MPVYQVVTSGVELTQEQRAELAKRFTEVHHGVTKALEPFIRIAFQPMPLGLMYTAGEVAPSLILHAGCRAGRTDATRHELLTKLYEVIHDVTRLPGDQVVVAISETPSSWLMEGGYVMPEPTPEAERAWMKQLQKSFPGKYDNYV